MLSCSENKSKKPELQLQKCRRRKGIKEGGGEVTTRKVKNKKPWASTGWLTDTHHFSELITPQVQPLQLCELLHASVDTQHRQTGSEILKSTGKISQDYKQSGSRASKRKKKGNQKVNFHVMFRIAYMLRVYSFH